MNINQYTDKIIKTLKETPADDHNTIWEVFLNDERVIKNRNFTKDNIQLLDTVFLSDIKTMKKEDIIHLWRYTDECDIHESLYTDVVPEYKGNIILDIKNEIVNLILCDIWLLHK
jgi:6-phosphogluconolactonase/glucosamine-6-phosphate isomerase/deaminase